MKQLDKLVCASPEIECRRLLLRLDGAGEPIEALGEAERAPGRVRVDERLDIRAGHNGHAFAGTPSQGSWVGTDHDETGDEVALARVVVGSPSQATESSATSAIGREASESPSASRSAPAGWATFGHSGKSGGQDDVRELPHKVHAFSRCANGWQGDHSVGRDALALCLGHRVRSIAARITRSCFETC
jgi:hypothetical protein